MPRTTVTWLFVIGGLERRRRRERRLTRVVRVELVHVRAAGRVAHILCVTRVVVYKYHIQKSFGQAISERSLQLQC